MKLFFLSFCTLTAFTVLAQPKLVNNAIISTSTNVIAPEDEDVSQIQNQGGGFNMRNMMNGDTKTTTYIKNDKVKTNFKSETFRGSMYRDNTAKTTTTIFEIMGNKQGFVASDNDQVEMRRKADSVMKERAKTDTGMHRTRTMDLPPASIAPLFAASIIPGPPPVIISKPASANNLPVSRAAM